MASPGDDPTLKTLGEIATASWQRRARRPARRARVIDADVATVSGAADKVNRAQSNPPWLLHLEFVPGHNAVALPTRVLARNALLHDCPSLPVRTLIVLLRREADTPVWNRSSRVELTEHAASAEIDFSY